MVSTIIVYVPPEPAVQAGLGRDRSPPRPAGTPGSISRCLARGWQAGAGSGSLHVGRSTGRSNFLREWRRGAKRSATGRGKGSCPLLTARPWRLAVSAGQAAPERKAEGGARTPPASLMAVSQPPPMHFKTKYVGSFFLFYTPLCHISFLPDISGNYWISQGIGVGVYRKDHSHWGFLITINWFKFQT